MDNKYANVISINRGPGVDLTAYAPLRNVRHDDPRRWASPAPAAHDLTRVPEDTFIERTSTAVTEPVSSYTLDSFTRFTGAAGMTLRLVRVEE